MIHIYTQNKQSRQDIFIDICGCTVGVFANAKLLDEWTLALVRVFESTILEISGINLN
jgi:hypothetical protein